MSKLFEPIHIGPLELPNRFVRSATAERMASADGRPRPELRHLYGDLARGGVGLIITGHMYIHPSGKAHPEMTGIHADDLIPDLHALCTAVHEVGGLIAAQINHGGMQCSRETVEVPVAPSSVAEPFVARRPRALRVDEIRDLVGWYAEAARRAQEASFDAVQIHGAHGYLVSQFLSPLTNRRADAWGPKERRSLAANMQGRASFLQAVCGAIREEVGPDYPLLIKLGMVDGVKGGLRPEDGAKIAGWLEDMGVDGVEISGGISGAESMSSRSPIKVPADEAYFRSLARLARAETSLPIALVGGLRSLQVMEEVLASNDADLISMSRPLICEPDLPERFRRGVQDRARCTSCDRCWPERAGEGIACRLPADE